MRFHFNLMNHTPIGQRSLLDPRAIIARQLQALGHEVVCADHGFSLRSAINVLFEGFRPPFVDLMRAAHAAGARFIIIATEEPTPHGFNHGLDPAMVERQAMFPDAARLADAIWCLVPGTHRWYGQFGTPAADLELGWSDRMMRIQPAEPTADFGFFGSISPRREAILQRLARRARIVVVRNLPPPEVRDQAIAGARVVLQIRPHEKVGLVSSSRCATALFLGRPVVAEPHKLSQVWGQVVQFAASDATFEREARHARRNWRDLHAEQLARFQRLLSPERCVGAALARTGLIPLPAAA